MAIQHNLPFVIFEAGEAPCDSVWKLKAQLLAEPQRRKAQGIFNSTPSSFVPKDLVTVVHSLIFKYGHFLSGCSQHPAYFIFSALR